MLPLFLPGWSTDSLYNLDKEAITFSLFGEEENLSANQVTGLAKKNLIMRRKSKMIECMQQLPKFIELSTK